MNTVGATEIGGMVRYFKEMDDPRSQVNRLHLLEDIIVISILGVLAGADGPLAIAQWASTQKAWLKNHLRLPHGTPSRDTIARVLKSLKPTAFQQCFAAWLTSLQEEPSVVENDQQDKPLRQIALDGKCLRRSHARGRGLGAMYLVSAWATDQGIALGQLAVEEKSNEITAIPRLLDQLDLTGAVVTIDAAGCQRNIADEIVSGDGDYVLALKGNHETLHRDVTDLFARLLEEDFNNTPVSRYEESDHGHGRTEQRYYYQISVPMDFPQREKWGGLKTFGLAIRRCIINGEETIDHRYYISSLPRHGRHFASYVRSHWSIENTLHWVLDMASREDESRVRERRLADNLGWLRRLALTLLKQHPGKQSIAMKRRLAGWSVDFLMQVLMGKAT
jgi:predicted transposase YbfD/YdcC